MESFGEQLERLAGFSAVMLECARPSRALGPQGRLSGSAEESKTMDNVRRILYAGVPSFFGSELEDDHVPTFWHLLYGCGVAAALGALEQERVLPGLLTNQGYVTPYVSSSPRTKKQETQSCDIRLGCSHIRPKAKRLLCQGKLLDSATCAAFEAYRFVDLTSRDVDDILASIFRVLRRHAADNIEKRK